MNVFSWITGIWFPRMLEKNRNILLSYAAFLTCLALLVLIFLWIPTFFPDTYVTDHSASAVLAEETPVPDHISTPTPVKAIYMTSWVAGSKKLRDPLITLVDETELNAIVIDIKDYTGRISFEVNDPALAVSGAAEERIKDIDGFLDHLHRKGIYVIGRLSVFQDQYLAGKGSEYAVRRKSDGAVWKDRKGVKWLDAGARPIWEYAEAIAKEAYSRGFDEINFDYIRFPSDGDMTDIAYPWSGNRRKAEVLKEFFAYIGGRLRSEGIPVSADLFGMTTTNRDDLNIGQILEDALANFDYVAPMVYPSHYPPNWNKFENPNKHPYEIVKLSLDAAALRAAAASTTPNAIRPWLQDFDYGGNYGPLEVRAQIQAAYDAGLNSWMLWSPSNQYTREALYIE